MSRYPVYGMSEDPIWSRGGSVIDPRSCSVMDPPRGQSHPPIYPTMPYTTYPAAHTTVMHSSVKPINDADIYRVGIYGWRKRCLYIFILILTIVIVLNLALTAWIMSVLDFSSDGMGALKIEEDGIRIHGRAQFDKPVHFSQLSTTKDEALTIDSFRGINMQARNASGHVSAKITIGSDGKAQAVCNRFEVRNKEIRAFKFQMSVDCA